MIREHEKPRGRRISPREAPRIHRAPERLQAPSIPVKITRILAVASLALLSGIGLAAADPAPMRSINRCGVLPIVTNVLVSVSKYWLPAVLVLTA